MEERRLILAFALSFAVLLGFKDVDELPVPAARGRHPRRARRRRAPGAPPPAPPLRSPSPASVADGRAAEPRARGGRRRW